MQARPIQNPPNPFASTDRVYLEGMDPGTTVQVYEDNSQEILARNDSPDLGFSFTVNPYRGCQHACAYCYARPTHEYLSFGAGTDFDTRIMVKRQAPDLLRAAFDKKSWRGETIVFSGVTDCYQPLEASYRITRACLLVCAEYKNPVGIITKAPLVERDVDVLQALAARARVHVSISIPFFNETNARKVEPYVATPARRLRTIETLSKAGISVGVMVAPVIPGLTEPDIPHILDAAKAAGASHAGYVLLRLPGAVKDVFAARMQAAFPGRAAKMLARMRDSHDGALYDARFGTRQRGQGPYAEAIARLFESAAVRAGLRQARAHDGAEHTTTPFQRPAPRTGQLALFGGTG